MSLEVLGPKEALVTDGTLVRVVFKMNPDVVLKMRSLVEASFANVTN